MITVTTPRGMHVRPSHMLYKKIKEIPTDIYIIHKNTKKKISSVLDILQMAIGQGDNIAFVPANPFCYNYISDLYHQINIINSKTYD